MSPSLHVILRTVVKLVVTDILTCNLSDSCLQSDCYSRSVRQFKFIVLVEGSNKFSLVNSVCNYVTVI